MCPEAKDMQITVDCLLLSFITVTICQHVTKQGLSEDISLSNE